MRMPMLAAAFLVTASPAFASAGYWCDADDAALTLAVEGGLSRSIPGPPFNTRGVLTVKLPNAPEDFSEIEITPDDLAQSWFDGDDIRIEIYREREADPFASISLVVKTTSVEEDVFAGTYELSIFAGSTDAEAEALEIKATGDASCGAG